MFLICSRFLPKHFQQFLQHFLKLSLPLSNHANGWKYVILERPATWILQYMNAGTQGHKPKKSLLEFCFVN